MKDLFALLCVMMMGVTQLNAQCQIPNGDFENWTDYTDSMEMELGLELSEEVFFPDGYFSLFRIVQLVFSDLIIDFFDTGMADRPLFASVERAEPGANGSQYCLQMRGDTLFDVTDLLSFNACGETPTSLKGFFRYEGEANDSLSIVVLFGDSTIVDESQTIAVTGFASGGGPSEWTEFESSVNYEEEGNTPDSMTVLIIVEKDQTVTGQTGFFQIDQLSLEGTTTAQFDQSRVVQDLVRPNPFGTYLELNPDRSIDRIWISDMQGREVRTVESPSPTLLTHDLAPGHYILRASNQDQVFVQKIHKQ